MLFRHKHSLQPPVNTVLPTVTGSFINGQTITGSDGTWTGDVAETQYRYRAGAAPYAESDYAVIVGATSVSYDLTGDEIGDRILRGVRKRGKDGFSAWVESLPSAIVQDSPALPLDLTGTPITTALQGSPYSFVVAALNGDPASSPPKYIFSLGGTWPPGLTLTPDADGDQATISGTPTLAGTYGGLTVNVVDDSGAADSIGPFTITVAAAGSYLTVVPGTGWTGSTAVASNFGSPSGVGYGFTPVIHYDHPPFDTLNAPFVLWIYARHTGDEDEYTAVGNPTYGIDHVRVSADNGAWLTIPAQYNTADQVWGYPVRIDPAMWADGIPSLTSTGQRMLRIIARPKNGNEFCVQGTPGDFFQTFRFSTNAGGSLASVIRYVSNAGSPSNDGLSEGAPKQTIEQALATIPSNSVNGATIEITTAGNYAYTASTARSATTRYLTVRGKSSLARDAVVLNSQTSGGLRVNLVRLKHLTQTMIINGNGANNNVHTWFDDVLSDRGSYPGVSYGWAKVGDITPYHATAGRVYFTSSRVDRYSNAFSSSYLVKNTSVGQIGSDLFKSTLFALNVTVDAVLSGTIESSPGVSAGVGNFHPDSCQYLGGGNTLGGGWFYGALLFNVTITSLNGQGPFFKDSNYVDGIFIENWDADMTPNAGRNSWSVFTSNSGWVFPYTILRNSHFWDCHFSPPGNADRGGGAVVDVVFKNCKINGSPISGTLIYEAAA